MKKNIFFTGPGNWYKNVCPHVFEKLFIQIYNIKYWSSIQLCFWLFCLSDDVLCFICCHFDGLLNFEYISYRLCPASFCKYYYQNEFTITFLQNFESEIEIIPTQYLQIYVHCMPTKELFLCALMHSNCIKWGFEVIHESLWFLLTHSIQNN